MRTWPAASSRSKFQRPPFTSTMASGTSTRTRSSTGARSTAARRRWSGRRRRRTPGRSSRRAHGVLRDVRLRVPLGQELAVGELAEGRQLAVQRDIFEFFLLSEEEVELRHRVQLNVVDEQGPALRHHHVDVTEVDEYARPVVGAVDEANVEAIIVGGESRQRGLGALAEEAQAVDCDLALRRLREDTIAQLGVWRDARQGTGVETAEQQRRHTRP